MKGKGGWKRVPDHVDADVEKRDEKPKTLKEVPDKEYAYRIWIRGIHDTQDVECDNPDKHLVSIINEVSSVRK